MNLLSSNNYSLTIPLELYINRADYHLHLAFLHSEGLATIPDRPIASQNPPEPSSILDYYLAMTDFDNPVLRQVLKRSIQRAYPKLK